MRSLTPMMASLMLPNLGHRRAHSQRDRHLAGRGWRAIFVVVSFQPPQPWRMTGDMIRPGLICILALGYLLTEVAPALADCVDVPAPGVYWRRCLQDGQDLRGVDLTGATLRDASFNRSDLTEAIMVEADGRRAKFVSAILHSAHLDHANLVRSDFTNADLTDASLAGADLTNARLFRADLSRADLTGARLSDTDLLKAVLAGATWIDGKTICSDDLVGQCHRSTARQGLSEAEPSG